jgi:hypothetical protein
MSTDPESRGGFGPYLPGVGPTFVDADSNQRMIQYGVIEDLEKALELHGKNTAAFLVEPIQGEAGYVNGFARVDRPSIQRPFFQDRRAPSWVSPESSGVVHSA